MILIVQFHNIILSYPIIDWFMSNIIIPNILSLMYCVVLNVIRMKSLFPIQFCNWYFNYSFSFLFILILVVECVFFFFLYPDLFNLICNNRFPFYNSNFELIYSSVNVYIMCLLICYLFNLYLFGMINVIIYVFLLNCLHVLLLLLCPIWYFLSTLTMS